MYNLFDKYLHSGRSFATSFKTCFPSSTQENVLNLQRRFPGSGSRSEWGGLGQGVDYRTVCGCLIKGRKLVPGSDSHETSHEMILPLYNSVN